MIRVLFGEKGAGKTKRIIQMANQTLLEAKGSIVFIDDDSQYMYEVKRSIRFVDASHFDIDGPKMFYGFLCGLAAQDHDLEHLFIDGFLKIVHHDLNTLEGLFTQLDKFAEDRKITITISISGKPEDVPAFLKGYVL
ncbi:hypothetical protein LJC42_01895 [Eubacteriales bacterium OttesenSCG-928-K08]|nr:hypothetical protein [Eubacteriales bacterium OttesenSCG-928-K08]